MSTERKSRVLIVDDDAMSRDLLIVLLESKGYAAESAESGEEALAQLGGAGPVPDVVLVDLQLPGISGSRLAGKLRRACGPAALLLAMSGSRPAARAIARFDGFLLKPFRMEEIAVALKARTKLAPASPAKREKWVVVAGPAGAARSRSKLVSISAPSMQKASQESMGLTKGRQPAKAADKEKPDMGPALNESIYQKLADAMPAKQLLEMYTLCVNDARTRIERMRQLAATGDEPQFAREAHAIKGGCGMLGATELHRLAAELEKNGPAVVASGGTREVNFLDELAAACDRLERMLRSRV